MAGQIKIEDFTIDIDQEKFVGTRDRSWGVRPVEAYDSQPPVPMSLPNFIGYGILLILMILPHSFILLMTLMEI